MTNSPFKIRDASDDDIAGIKQLIQPYVQQRKLLDRTDAELHTLIANGFAAMIDDQLVGFAAVEIYSRKMAEIQCLAVSPTAQGIGIGKQLILKCIDRAKEKNVVEVLAITASEAIFMDCGFDFSLPDQKKAMFFQTGNRDRPSPGE
ncbi:MAG: amino-acid N-acetyltransferase [Pirellulaceae bacterium]|jgi:amino-acid N-acetyltransferase